MNDLCGKDAASIEQPVLHLPPPAESGKRRAPYSSEVFAVMLEGRVPNVYVFAGPECWDRANQRRIHRGLGTALVLPDDCSPEQLIWPAVEAVIVAWPIHGDCDRTRKLRLAQALIRDGVRFAAIEHAPQWIRAWREGAHPND